MTTDPAVFLDANVIIYALDSSSPFHEEVVTVIQQLHNKSAQLCASHHVIEEVLHIISRLQLSTTKPTLVIDQIKQFPNLILIEPDANLSFAQRYASLSEQLNTGINDSLLLQLLLDAGINLLYTYDKKFMNRASQLAISDARSYV